jgi:hypothetical protein
VSQALGNYRFGRGETREAVASFEEALLARHPEYRDAEMLLGELTRKKSP